MFQHIVYSVANRQGLFAYVRTCKKPGLVIQQRVTGLQLRATGLQLRVTGP